MKQTLKTFCHRGLMFGGFGPIILGIIYAVLERTVENFTLSSIQLLIGIVSVYLLAFVQAGASVFNQIEHWSIPQSSLCHFAILYAAYVLCYLVNRWIPFDWHVILIFTVIFVVGYLIIWLVVWLTVKQVSRRLNKRIAE